MSRPLARRSLRVATPLVALAALVLAPVSADAAVTIPVSCVSDEVVLDWDGATYELYGACGIVVVEADDATVTMPTATHLYVTGDDSEVTAKPQTLVEISGARSSVTMTSATTLSITGAGSSATVEGLVEQVRMRADATSLSADRTHVLVMRGAGNVAVVRRGFRTRVVGSENTLEHQRLDRLRIRGDANTVTVAAGATASRVVGTGNTVSVVRPPR